MKKNCLALLIAAVFLTGCSNAGDDISATPPCETTDEASVGIEENSELRFFSMEMNNYNTVATTAKCTKSSNAADFTSLLIEANSGECVVFENIDFTGAECLLLEAAVPEDSTGKIVDLYIDEISEENKIGVLTTTGLAKSNDFEFIDHYAEIKSVQGEHSLIFSFPKAVTLEADWFKLTSYTGTENEEEFDKRMEWWRDAKYGQFIHFGAYSYLGGEYLGEPVGWYSEWIMSSKNISKEDYAANATAYFNPKDFDAEKIVADAKAAGQKYLIITSRHHEGLSIYDTKIRNFKDYSLMNPAVCPLYNGGDILKELSDECKKQGIHFGVYTTIMDWHDPTQTGLNNNHIAPGHTKAEYKTQLKGQLKELIEDYGAEVFFFDGEWVSWWTEDDGRELYRYILSLNENCIVNNRVGKRNHSDGDYGTPEQEIPVNGLDYDWESNVTMNDSFGYKKGDTNWKSVQWIIDSVLDVASKGGNMLLNVGPDGNGVVEEAPLSNMADAGKWLEKYGDAVYNTRRTCFSRNIAANIRVTTNPEKGKVYITLLKDAPNEVGGIILPALDNEILSVTEMSDGSEVPYEVLDGSVILNIADTKQEQYATVYEITVEGIPAEKPAADQQADVAAGKAVVTSSHFDGKDGSLITDGNTAATNENRWAPLDSDHSPWAVIDLGALTKVEEIVIYEWLDTFYTQDYRVESFRLAVSSDNESWTEVHEGTHIGERLSVVLEKVIECRYVKLYDVERVPDAKGTPSFHEIEVFERRQREPQISFNDVSDRIESLPFAVKGQYSDGTKVTLKVWGASFAAFNVEATVDENGGWYAEIEGDRLAEGSIVLTAILSDNDGNHLATSVHTVQY